MTAADGTDLKADVEIAPECNFLHMMWSQIDLYLNGSLVTQSNNNYPYRTHIENLLSFGQDAKSSQLSAVLLYRNTAGQFDVRGDANSGYTTHKELAAQSTQIDMMGRLYVVFHFKTVICRME